VNEPLEERRKVFDEIFEKVRSKDSLIKLSETIDATSTELVRVARQLGFEGILAKRRDSYYESGQAKRCVAQVSYQPRPRTCHRRLCSRKPHRFHHRRALSRWHTAVHGQGAKRLCSPHAACGSSQTERPRNRHLPVCESARAQTHAVGLDEGRDEKLQMGEARSGGADRVYRVDTGCASTAIRFRRPAKRQRPA
jgi:hypothetical protein